MSYAKSAHEVTSKFAKNLNREYVIPKALEGSKIRIDFEGCIYFFSEEVSKPSLVEKLSLNFTRAELIK